jgi:hypothetical protein
MAYRYDAFLGEPEKATRHSTKPNGSPTSGELSDFGWWLLCCSLLRNKIVHGDAVTTPDYMHDDGRHHLAIGERRLRDAILLRAQEVAGVDDLLLGSFERKIGRGWAEHVNDASEGDSQVEPLARRFDAEEPRFLSLAALRDLATASTLPRRRSWSRLVEE